MTGSASNPGRLAGICSGPIKKSKKNAFNVDYSGNDQAIELLLSQVREGELKWHVGETVTGFKIIVKTNKLPVGCD